MLFGNHSLASSVHLSQLQSSLCHSYMLVKLQLSNFFHWFILISKICHLSCSRPPVVNVHIVEIKSHYIVSNYFSVPEILKQNLFFSCFASSFKVNTYENFLWNNPCFFGDSSSVFKIEMETFMPFLTASPYSWHCLALDCVNTSIFTYLYRQRRHVFIISTIRCSEGQMTMKIDHPLKLNKLSEAEIS